MKAKQERKDKHVSVEARVCERPVLLGERPVVLGERARDGVLGRGGDARRRGRG